MFRARYGNLLVEKGLQIIPPHTQTRIGFNHFWGLRTGTPLSFNLNAYNPTGKAFDGQVRLTVLDDNENPLYTLLDQKHHFPADGTFTHSGQFQFPASSTQKFSTGFKVRLGVDFPDGTSTSYQRNLVYFLPSFFLSALRELGGDASLFPETGFRTYCSGLGDKI